jgi:hypothetical protein
MVDSLSSALDQIKRNPLQMIARATIERICRESGYGWRDRELDPATTLGLFIQQVLHGNAPCTEIRHIAGQAITASAYCQARSRLPLKVYQQLLQEVCEQGSSSIDEQADARWHGHRTWLLDGSTFSMPDTPELQEAFGQPSGQKPGCGFPNAHVLTLFNAKSGLLARIIAAGCTRGDPADVPEIFQHLQAGDVVVGDDSFGSFVILALLQAGTMHGLFPVHHARTVDFTPRRPFAREGAKHTQAGLPHSEWLKSLGKEDQLVRYFKPKQKPAWMTEQAFAALPESIVVRELRRRVHHPTAGEVTLTIVTTLVDPKLYPAQDLEKLRLCRWGVETDLGHLKTTMKMDVLKCKTEAGVRKEMTIFALVYNLTRLVMWEASRRQKVAADRISFADTLAWLRHVRPGATLPHLVVRPLRPDRVEPRVKKRRPKQYDLMNKPRSVLKEALKARSRKA